MEQLPLELRRLDEHYDRIVSAVSAGRVSLQTARSAVESMVVMDPTGSLWRMNDDGLFVCARSSGEPFRVADPLLWPSSGPMAPVVIPAAQVAPRTDLFSPPTFDQVSIPDFARAAQAAPAASQPAPLPPQQSQQPISIVQAPGGSAPAYPSSYSPSYDDLITPPSMSAQPPSWATELPADLSALAVPSKEEKKSRMPKLPDFKHKTTIIVIIIGLALIAAAFFSTRSSSESPDPQPSPTSSMPELPVDSPSPDPSQEQTEAPTPPSGPSSEDASAAISALSSSAQAGAGAVLSSPSDPDLALASFVLLGATNQGYGVRVSEPKKSGKGLYTQRWTIFNSADDQAILAANVSWKLSDGVWKLQRPPAFKPA